jgi:hypothetical protein
MWLLHKIAWMIGYTEAWIKHVRKNLSGSIDRRTIRVIIFILITSLIVTLFVNKITASVYAIIALIFQYLAEPKNK